MSSPEGNRQNTVSQGLHEAYSVPWETRKLFQNGLLKNPLIAPTLPKEIEECAKLVEFEGSDDPSIPINWRFAESVASLKGLEATMINVLLGRKYGIGPQRAVINTDHAQLFIMSVILWTIDPEGSNLNPGSLTSPEGNAEFSKYFKDKDMYQMRTGHYRSSSTNIYRCKDGRYFHLHSSMNPDPTLQIIGLPPRQEFATAEESYKPFIEAMSQIDSGEMQHRASDVYKQAGTICYTTDEYADSPHGKANAHVGLYEIHHRPNPAQPPTWWPDSYSQGAETGPKRPLAGLKVLDLTRVIAAPAVTRGLAEYGASVMRVTAPHLPDMSGLHVDMNWGKWNAELDFRVEEDREKLRDLVREADVVVMGYRPGVLDKYGFSPEGLVELCKDRERGLIVARENCYGWNGPWENRSGWQQISDASTGVSWGFGKALGLDEPVTPVFPNSDFCTGVCGVVGILVAVVRRAEEGGSFVVDLALNYYSQWLTRTVGTYPPSTWSDLWARNGNQVLRHYHNLPHALPLYMGILKTHSGERLFNDKYFENRYSTAIAKTVRTIRPVVTFPDGVVELGFRVGTRGNGVDKAIWPADLGTEVVG